MRVPERFRLIHIVASPAALDKAEYLRIAPDEALAFAAPEYIDDPYAIVEPDDGYAGLWLDAQEAEKFLARACEWELPPHRPAFAQGAVAGLPAKLWIERDRMLILVPAPYAADLEERLA